MTDPSRGHLLATGMLVVDVVILTKDYTLLTRLERLCPLRSGNVVGVCIISVRVLGLMVRL